ncbi:MAG: YceI family protein [Ilumatobacteraceae bacterium]
MTESGDVRPERFPRWLKWSLFSALGVLVIGYGAILVYANFINDGPEAFDEADLEAALTATTIELTASSTATAPSPSPTTTATPSPTSTSPESRQQWRIASGSEVGYRVKEVLFGVDTDGVGRTGAVSGGIEIDGTNVVVASFDVDVASIESDDARRDSQFRGRIMSADEFPLATFVLTAPIDLGTESADGVTVTTTATGELTLRGVTNSVTFEVSAQREDGRIGILGSIPVVFAEYGIANPSFGGITTEDVGLVEFILVLEPA